MGRKTERRGKGQGYKEERGVKGRGHVKTERENKLDMYVLLLGGILYFYVLKNASLVSCYIECNDPTILGTQMVSLSLQSVIHPELSGGITTLTVITLVQQ